MNPPSGPLYSNENIALQVVTELRRLGHDVLTSLDAGRANASVPDSEVLAFVVGKGRMLSHNHRDCLHCMAQRIHQTIAASELSNLLIRVNRPG